MKKICLIIPTKDRPFELERLLKSFAEQDVKTSQIIIVDGGEGEGIKSVADKFSNLNIDYLQVLPPGLTRQRNAGLKLVKQEMDVVGFLDDDIVLKPHCIKNLLDFWENAEDDVVGVGFNIIDYPVSEKSALVESFFKSKQAGTILITGRNLPYCPAEKTHETQWLCGGATTWKKDLFDEYDFDEWFAKYGIVEDVDFSVRVGTGKRLFVVAEAQVLHLELPKKRHYFLGYIVAMNHLYLAKKHKQFSFSLCILYFLTNGLSWILKGIVTLNVETIQRGTGFFLGALKGGLFGVSRIDKQIKG